MKTRTFQVLSEKFTAGITFDVETKNCIETAPVLYWLMGKSFQYFKFQCRYKGWKLRRVPDGKVLGGVGDVG